MPVTRTEPGYSTEQIENDLSALRGQHDALNEYQESTTLVIGTTLAIQQPGTTNSLASNGTPMTQEAPHSITMGGSPSWTGTVRYWLNPSGTSVHISISNATASASGANGNTFATLPTGYTPNATRGAAIGCSAVNTSPTVGANITVNSSGQMQSTGVAAGATGIYCEWDMPLI